MKGYGKPARQASCHPESLSLPIRKWEETAATWETRTRGVSRNADGAALQSEKLRAQMQTLPGRCWAQGPLRSPAPRSPHSPPASGSS